MDDILVPTSPGELIDKITILRIKSERIADAAKLANVRAELAALQRVAATHLPERADLGEMARELYLVNVALWEIEDDIRGCERAGDFGDRFVALARSVYRTNDRRAAVKKQINLALGSALLEEKSYDDSGEDA